MGELDAFMAMNSSLGPPGLGDILAGPVGRNKDEKNKRKALRASKKKNKKRKSKNTVRTKGKTHGVRGKLKKKKPKTSRHPSKKKK